MTNKIQSAGLTSIVAIDTLGAIGCRNQLPWTLKSDIAFFRRMTLGNSVIMGRKTYDSIGGCLPNRMNVVLSHNFNLFERTPNYQVALSLGETLYRAGRNGTESTYVIGGALTYAQFAPFVDRYLVTIVDHQVPDADAFLDQSILNQFALWDRALISRIDATDERDEHTFSIYEIIPDDAEDRKLKQTKLVADYEAQIPNQAPKSKVRKMDSAWSQAALSL
jgi:dihydrofolate reductase